MYGVGKPDENWNLEQLGEFCSKWAGRMAVDAWWLGWAILLAKQKAKHGEFSEWKRRHCFSDSMASRCMRLCTSTTPEQLAGYRITEVMFASGVLPKPKAKSPVSKFNRTVPKRENPNDASWAVEGPQTSESSTVTMPSFDPAFPTPLDELRFEVEDLSNRLAHLTDFIESLLTHSPEEWNQVWPIDKSESHRADIMRLCNRLQKLAKEIPKAGRKNKGKGAELVEMAGV